MTDRNCEECGHRASHHPKKIKMVKGRESRSWPCRMCRCKNFADKER